MNSSPIEHERFNTVDSKTKLVSEINSIFKGSNDSTAIEVAKIISTDSNSTTSDANISSTIDMLKFALYKDEKIDKLQDILNNLKEINYTLDSKIDIPSVNISHQLFKKINLLFKSLSNLIKILLLRIDDEQYQDAKDQKIIFPHDIETLIIILGTFDKAFNEELTDILFQIISWPTFGDLYNISSINTMLIPFVADDKIDEILLKKDFDDFSILVKDFACEVLNLNIDFEPHNWIEAVSIEEKSSKDF